MDTWAAPSMSWDGDGRTIAITGAASGIGAATKRLLESKGARVIGVDLSGVDIAADLSEREARTAAVDEIATACGGMTDGVLDGLALCAGVGPHVTPTESIVAVNYFGAVDVLDGLLPLLSRSSSGAAVVIASNSASIIPPDETLLTALADGDEVRARATAAAMDGATVYGVSKRGLVRAVRTRSVEWGTAGVRVNAIAPGPVETPLLAGSRDDPVLGPLVDALPVPLARHASADEIAEVVTFLMGAGSSFIHGAVLFVDGGTDATLRPDAI